MAELSDHAPQKAGDKQALEKKPDDIKVVIQCSEVRSYKRWVLLRLPIRTNRDGKKRSNDVEGGL